MQPLKSVQVLPNVIAEAKRQGTYPFVPSSLEQVIIDGLPKDSSVLVGGHSVNHSRLIAIANAGNLSIVLSEDGTVEFLVPQDIHSDFAIGNAAFGDAIDETLKKS